MFATPLKQNLMWIFDTYCQVKGIYTWFERISWGKVNHIFIWSFIEVRTWFKSPTLSLIICSGRQSIWVGLAASSPFQWIQTNRLWKAEQLIVWLTITGEWEVSWTGKCLSYPRFYWTLLNLLSFELFPPAPSHGFLKD